MRKINSLHFIAVAACLMAGGSVMAADSPAAAPLDQRSYAGVLKGIEAFAAHRALAPNASLSFQLYPRRQEAGAVRPTLAIVSGGARTPLTLEADGSFKVPVRPDLNGPGAMLQSNQPEGSFAWRPVVRTPGLPAHVRRLGDLRLQCRVDLNAGLMVVPPSRANQALMASNPGRACEMSQAFYPIFADRPVFEVTLVSGSRRRVLLTQESLYGMGAPASRLPLLDWPHLRDRVVRLPLHDSAWPDDTQVVFEFLEPLP